MKLLSTKATEANIEDATVLLEVLMESGQNMEAEVVNALQSMNTLHLLEHIPSIYNQDMLIMFYSWAQVHRTIKPIIYSETLNDEEKLTQIYNLAKDNLDKNEKLSDVEDNLPEILIEDAILEFRRQAWSDILNTVTSLVSP